MKATRLVVQLFNSPARTELLSDLEDSRPSHFWGESQLRVAGFEILTIPPFAWPLNPAARLHNAFCGLDLLRALRVLITQRKAAVICAHLESAFFILMLRKVFRFHPRIVVWEVPWSPGWRYREVISNLSIPRADCLIVFSTNQIDRIRHIYGSDLDIEFIPFCVDTRFFNPRLETSNNAGYIFSSGLDAGRDFSILIEATRDIRTNVIIKAPSNMLQNITSTNTNVSCLDKHLSFSEYRLMYSRAAIVVITTKETVNASGVTSLLEAMAMGKPVIVSNNSALKDYLPPSDAGITVPVGDVAALRSAIHNLLADPEAAKQMGMKAREFVEGKFNPLAHFKAAAEVFSRVAAG